jgi:hypothetical protein
MSKIFFYQCDVKLFLTFTSLNLVLWREEEEDEESYFYLKSSYETVISSSRGYYSLGDKGNNKITELRTILQHYINPAVEIYFPTDN